MLRSVLPALAALSFALAESDAIADTYKDAGQTTSMGTVDVSRTSGAHIQCNITVTTTAASLASLWTAANCPVAMPSSPQFAWVEPTGGAIWYSTDGQNPVAANTAGASSFPILQNQAWPIEGRLSVNALTMIAASPVAVSVELRF